MTIALANARTPVAYPQGVLSAQKLHDVILAYNELMEDVHDFTGLMDADTGITDTNYEAQLTAAQINLAGYTPTETTPTPRVGIAGQFPANEYSELLARTFTEELVDAIADIDTIITKLDNDGGVTFALFSWSRYRAARLMYRATDIEDQDSVQTILMLGDRNHYGELLAAGAADAGEDVSILRSTDDGRSWHVFSTLPTAVRAVVSLVQTGVNRRDQVDSRLLAFCVTASAAVLYESADFGRSWTDVSSRLPTLSSTIWTDALRLPGGTILASGGSAGETVRSTDGGLTFSEVVITGPTAVNSLGYSPSTGKVMACGDDAILYSSTDDGASYGVEEDFSGGNPDDCRRFLELRNGWWLVTTHDADGTDELIRSDDQGATWETPVAVTGAQDELGHMVQGPDGIVYLQVGANIQVSDDNGVSVEISSNGIDLPNNDLAVSCFAKNRLGEVLCGTTNTTDFAGIFRCGIRQNVIMDAFADAGAFLGPQHGDGPDGRWLDWAQDQLTILTERWSSLGANMDDDGDIDTNTYEATIAQPILTIARSEPAYDLHNTRR